MRRHPLLWMIALVAIITVTLLAIETVDIEHYIDPPMLTVIVVAYLIAALVMLARTGWAYWTLLGAGLLATMSADALLYGFILAGQLDIDRPFAVLWLALIRALLTVGGVMVLIGLWREWRAGLPTGGDER